MKLHRLVILFAAIGSFVMAAEPGHGQAVKQTQKEVTAGEVLRAARNSARRTGRPRGADVRLINVTRTGNTVSGQIYAHWEDSYAWPIGRVVYVDGTFPFSFSGHTSQELASFSVGPIKGSVDVELDFYPSPNRVCARLRLKVPGGNAATPQQCKGFTRTRTH